jgi:hypothetical protein
MLRYCIVPVLILIFSLQQFSLFAFDQTPEKYITGYPVKIQTGNQPASVQVAADLPFDSPPPEPEAEVVEEDETKSHTAKYWTPPEYRRSASDVYFTSSLNSRLLQIVWSLHNRLSIPFFILHHSWKSFIG